MLRIRDSISIAACVLLLAIFGLLSWGTASTKSATCDEPLHATAGYLHVFHHDFRIDPEDPPLWEYWAMLPHRAGDLRPDFDDPDWQLSLSTEGRKNWFCARTLYRTPGIDGEAFIERSRLLMLGLGVVLGALVVWWAWDLGGAGAAVLAAIFFSLDPGFLGHSPLVKNDVALSLLLVALMMAMWRMGRRATVWNIASVALICGAALAVKFSAVIFPMLIAVTALARAMLGESWPFLGRQLQSRQIRIAAAGALLVVVAMVSWVIIWASYGFRFDPTPDPALHLNLDLPTGNAARNLFFIREWRYPTDDELAGLPRPPLARAVAWASGHRLLPEAWMYGFLYTYQSALARPAFLCGETSDTGWW